MTQGEGSQDITRRTFLKWCGTVGGAVLMESMLGCSLNVMQTGSESGAGGQDTAASAAAERTAEALSSGQPRNNVLFIAVDDLRTQLNCYGAEQMITPHMDRLAHNGVLFKRAYCQQAICNPSRCSILSGLRPDSTKVYTNKVQLRKAMPNVLTLPEHFKQNGYETISVGKVYHFMTDDARSWSKPPYRAPNYFPGYADEASLNILRSGKYTNPEGAKLGPAYESPDLPDSSYPDAQATDYAISELKRLQREEKPFFLAMGYHKPHLPFTAPKKYWELYDREQISLPDNRYFPNNAPKIASMNDAELRGYYGMPKRGSIPDSIARTLIHGYYACVSFLDAQVGRLLEELERLGLADSTVIVLWADHGWKLGEHDMWTKQTNYEPDVHVPLIVHAPGVQGNGRASAALVEQVDMYPTLCELTGLPIPGHLEGLSLVPLLSNPERSWKKAAFSQFPRPGGMMGYSMKTEQFRYTEWRQTASGKLTARELYDHRIDPWENDNVAGSDDYKETVASLAAMMKGGWRGALPD